MCPWISTPVFTTGHTGNVPISHSLNAFNVLTARKGRLSDDQIKYFIEKEQTPPELITDVCDPLYGEKPVLFRRQSGNARITIFEGGHETIDSAALTWLAKHQQP